MDFLVWQSLNLPDRDQIALTSFSLRSEEEIQTFVRGCTFYGTGGGGSPDYGREILMSVLNSGKAIRVSDVTEVSDDVWTCSAYGMGSIAPRTPKVLDEMKSLGLANGSVDYKLREAIKELERYTNTEVSVIVPVEIGGANTPDPVATASLMGLEVVDADYTGGRACPAAVQTMIHLQGKSMFPLVSVDEWGDVVILKKTVNNMVSEKLGKLVSVLAYGNLAGNATWLLKGGEMKRFVTPGTLSRAFETGRRIDELRMGKTDLQQFTRSISAHHLFQGKVISKEEENRDAEYYWGSYVLEGEEKFKGHTFKIWFKNENHMTWFDGRAYVTSPDLVTAIDSRSWEPAINPRIRKGDQLAVFGLKAMDAFRTGTALEFFGPKHFGFDVKYTPLENIAGSME